MKLSEYIKKYRADNNLSLRAMSDRCNCSYQYLSKLENNEIDTPQLKMLIKLADGMGITVHELLDSVDDMTVYTKTYNISIESDPRLSRFAPKLAKDQLKDDISKAYDKADEKTKKMVRMLLGLE